MPFFSIIIPSYNRLHTLPATIESVMKQTYTDYEVIVSDDGSTDGTANWIKEQENNRIKYIYQTNAGVCAARNKGASIAEGEYLIFLDSDDQVTVTWLFDFKQTIDEYDAYVVYCNRLINNQTNNGGGYQGFLAGTFAVKKDLFISVGGYDEVLKFGENTELKWRLSQAGAKIIFFNKSNVIYDVTTNGGGSNRINRIDFYYHISKKHANYFRNNKKEQQLLCRVAVVDCFILNRKLEAISLLCKGYILRPYNLKFILSSFYYLIKYILKLK